MTNLEKIRQENFIPDQWQISNRYRVRRHPGTGFWCVVDRKWLAFVDEYDYFVDWGSCTIDIDMVPLTWRDPDDALEFVRLLKLSDNTNGGRE
jgi:hypothetical protein